MTFLIAIVAAAISGLCLFWYMSIGVEGFQCLGGSGGVCLGEQLLGLDKWTVSVWRTSLEVV